MLDTTTSLSLPVNSASSLFITSSDVIHSFSVPSFGLKVDAVPGRVNTTTLLHYLLAYSTVSVKSCVAQPTLLCLFQLQSCSLQLYIN